MKNDLTHSLTCNGGVLFKKIRYGNNDLLIARFKNSCPCKVTVVY